MHGRALLRQHEHTFGSQFCQKQIKTSYLWLAFFFFLVPFRLYDSEHIWITRALDWNVAIRGENEANFKVSSLQRCLPLCITRFLFFWKKESTDLERTATFLLQRRNETKFSRLALPMNEAMRQMGCDKMLHLGFLLSFSLYAILMTFDSP